MPCTASEKTLTEVSQCPKNQLEWVIEAEKANCSSVYQTCVEAEEFVFHCVLNTKLTGFLQVCAPAKPIHGKMCPEYNIRGNIIQESLSAGCGTDRIPCPPVYLSTEAYKYQECYHSVKYNENKTENNGTEFNLHNSNCKTEITYCLELFSVLAGVLILLNVGCYFGIWRKRFMDKGNPVTQLPLSDVNCPETSAMINDRHVDHG
ncbi:uncharacterized protein LOC133201815 [Saccostrea echinata]|uniref:uncharacterized protein LOC133201815 n=1 Tax=Saccostrea echinata TaxID=191078 RepID=UPI002A829E1B|nr:uncharacterized protein LOC133201815 [Saccostrea echinata]